MNTFTKISMTLLSLMLACFSLQASNEFLKGAPNRVGAIYSYLPDGYQQVGNTNCYWAKVSTSYGNYQKNIDLLGQFSQYYYSSTYNNSGYRAAFQVNDGEAVILDSWDGSSVDGVNASASVYSLGELSRMVYSFTNTTTEPVTINAGVWADVCIGDNDYAAIERRLDPNDNVYGLTMKYDSYQGAPAFFAIFNIDLAGLSKADDYWFGFYGQNNNPTNIVGNYGQGSNWMQENGNYDSGMGWCWKNREIQPGETIELSYALGVGDVNFSYAEFEVVPTNLEVWNEMDQPHPFKVNGIYVSPLGLNGHIYYQVDESEEWIEIAGTILSGGNFSLPFEVMFTQGLPNHELRFRIIDEAENITELGSVSWEDVIAYPVTGAFEDCVYNGGPQTFDDLTYDIDDSKWVTYYRDNITPGTGYFVTEGLYPYTIGRVEYPFTIDKAPCVYEVELPDAQVVYDGEGHGATVIVPEGSGTVTITYVNTETGEILTDMPVHYGTYEIYVMIGEGEYYYGIDNTLVGEFEIVKGTAIEQIVVNKTNDNVIYNMQGVRVSNATAPGLYITNGKKILVK